MTLEVTPRELKRLQKHLHSANRRAHNNPKTCTPDREGEIVQMVKAGASSGEIKREMGVSDNTIIVIRRRNGLWGI